MWKSDLKRKRKEAKAKVAKKKREEVAEKCGMTQKTLQEAIDEQLEVIRARRDTLPDIENEIETIKDEIRNIPSGPISFRKKRILEKRLEERESLYARIESGDEERQFLNKTIPFLDAQRQRNDTRKTEEKRETAEIARHTLFTTHEMALAKLPSLTISGDDSDEDASLDEKDNAIDIMDDDEMDDGGMCVGQGVIGRDNTGIVRRSLPDEKLAIAIRSQMTQERAEQSALVVEFLTEVCKVDPAAHVVKHDVCHRCKNVMVEVPHESRMVCSKCGITANFLDATQASVGFNGDVEITSFKYKRINHFKDWLLRTQGKESFQVPKASIKMIMRQLSKEGVHEKDITRKRLRQCMKDLKEFGVNRYYNHIAQIHFKVTGIPPPKMDMFQEERCILMFIAIQEPFEKHCPPWRQNFLSYGYCLYKFCQLLGYVEFLPYFSLLKGKDKLRIHDDIWKPICEDNEWVYLPSVRAVGDTTTWV